MVNCHSLKRYIQCLSIFVSIIWVQILLKHYFTGMYCHDRLCGIYFYILREFKSHHFLRGWQTYNGITSLISPNILKNLNRTQTLRLKFSAWVYSPPSNKGQWVLPYFLIRRLKKRHNIKHTWVSLSFWRARFYIIFTIKASSFSKFCSSFYMWHMLILSSSNLVIYATHKWLSINSQNETGS